MRNDGFLRTPIRGNHQNRLQNLQVDERPLSGNPAPSEPYPQTLEISFEVASTTTEIEIAPLWEGALFFLPDSTANKPANPLDVTESNVANWSLTGDIVLQSLNVIDKAFATHIPFISPPPRSVRYSKIQLTQNFLFTTLRQLASVRVIYKGKVVDKRDPQWHAKLVISFLQGQGSILCPVDPTDATKDFAGNPMPIVKLEPTGTRTVLRVTVASRVEEADKRDWFKQRPEYDSISGEQLVPPELDTVEHQGFNPAHPSHSVIPARAIFQSAAPAAYAPDHTATSPLRQILRAARPDGKTYRRIELIRPPLPGKSVSSYPQRPFPMYQLCWRSGAGGNPESVRIPLEGRLYLPLIDGNYSFWAIPRSQSPQSITSGDQLKLSQKSSTAKYIGLPQPRSDVALGSSKTSTIYAHLQEYDSKFVWEAYRSLTNATIEKHMKKADRQWNAKVLRWIIPRFPERAPYASIYGLIRESAGRHGFAPEFLQSVFMGEGGIKAVEDRPTFDELEPLDSFGFVGLDLILYRLGKLPAGVPRHPKALDDKQKELDKKFTGAEHAEKTAELAEEIAEYYENLQVKGYVDSSFADRVKPKLHDDTNEFGYILRCAIVEGWAAAIELVAAELSVRLDEMLAYCKNEKISVNTQKERDFLAYVRFNTKLSVAKGVADNLKKRVQKWPHARPAENDNRWVVYNTVQRLAVAQWYEAASVYR